MVSFFIQSTFLFLVIVFQISFLSVVFSDLFVNALLATAISLTLTRGFFASWPWVIFLGGMFDLVSMGVVGVTSVVLIVFSYGISFLSRRFLGEHKGSGMVLSVLFMSVASLFYFPLIWMVRRVALGTVLPSDSFSVYFSTVNFTASIVLNTVLFVILYAITSKIQQTLHWHEERVVVKR